MTAKEKNERLSHIDETGQARMVPVGQKELLERVAVATAEVKISKVCAEEVAANNIKKGDVLGTAQLAGVMAAKRTADLIPMCHPLALDHIEVNCRLEGQTVRIEARVSARERTGVEMEALTGASVAALTVFDMCKAVDPAMVIGPVQVERKTKDGQVSFERSNVDGQG
jgi:cyclic pyranopterin monophosphate synthase